MHPESRPSLLPFNMVDPSGRVKGYPLLASFFSSSPELSILRSFREPAMLDLLYLQAEITQLVDKLRAYQKADSESDDESRRKYAKDWYWLSQSAETGSNDQLRIILSLREKLKEYCMFLHSMPTAHET